MPDVFGFELLAQQAAEIAAAEVSQLAAIIQHGDTPIEKLLALALITYDQFEYSFGMASCGVIFLPDDHHLLERYPDAMRIECQVELGGWRVDFLIRSRWSDAAERALIVECDGHDFHERTKDQAARDKSRDRAAVIEGIPVFRFTGSEIWRDPMGCARQIFDWKRQGP